MYVPSLILKKLHTYGSLENVVSGGIKFSLKNRLSDAHFTSFNGLSINGEPISLSNIWIDLGEGEIISPEDLSDNPINFPLRKTINILADVPHLENGKHKLEISFSAKPFGNLNLKVDDSILDNQSHLVRIPRNAKDDYGDEIIEKRQHFVEEFSGKKLKHLPTYSFDPHILQGNCEHFTGVAKVPIGFAGPIKINGEHAKGEFIIPLATTEGTLVASYNRGMKVINLCGGVTCTVQRDAMQRAPVFVFENARAARDFVEWTKENFDEIAKHAEATTSIGRLLYIDPYLASKFAYLRFNFSTGDAAGQNMVGKATFATCSWILDHYKDYPIKHFFLESNLATDKKASQINLMRTRGKRVTAEITVKREVLLQQMRVETETLAYHAQVANIGAILSGANNNGLHSANAIAAMFIATGQDVADVAESSAGIVHTELTPEKDLYFSITIPSLIVATYGGGTALATQKECLDLLGCVGKGKVKKLAEIIAGTVLAGEISLAAAISASDWVSSHDRYGRNK
ncbi:MAG: hydroxymethylglutaryl-CoA reductase [Bacteroidetes bacterium]|nr:hydroxymethylglutaryl-CoA reductase [Bacteroidota bacterium]